MHVVQAEADVTLTEAVKAQLMCYTNAVQRIASACFQIRCMPADATRENDQFAATQIIICPNSVGCHNSQCPGSNASQFSGTPTSQDPTACTLLCNRSRHRAHPRHGQGHYQCLARWLSIRTSNGYPRLCMASPCHRILVSQHIHM